MLGVRGRGVFNRTASRKLLLLPQVSGRAAAAGVALLGRDVAVGRERSRWNGSAGDVARWGFDGGSRRRFSSQPDNIADKAIDTIESSVESSFSSYFDLTRIMALSVSEGTGVATAEAVAQLGNWPSDYAIRLLEIMQHSTGLPYWLTIVLSTLALRTVLFPLTIMTAKNAARMTLMKPEMELLTETIKAATPGDRAAQQRYQREMSGLFQKYNCKPARTIMGPLGNIAVFVPMFFGLRKAGDYLPGLSEGGAYWFMDLGAADPTYVLPTFVTMTFLVVTEVGMDGMKMDAGPQMKLVFRVLPIIFLPMTASMPAGCLIYWCTSNAFSVGQTLILRNKTLKKYFGIPEIPATAQAKAENPFKKLLEQYEERKRSKAIADSEILYGKRPPPPPSSKGSSVVTTYASPPPKPVVHPSSKQPSGSPHHQAGRESNSTAGTR